MVWKYDEVMKFLKNNGAEQRSLDRLRKLGDHPEQLTCSVHSHNDGTLIFELEMMCVCLDGVLGQNENVYFNEITVESVDIEVSPSELKPWLLTKTTATIKYSPEVD